MALWVIEADGKVKRFQEILKKAGIRGAEVFATGGHLFSAPRSLHPLGIDRNYQDVRNPVRPDRVEQLTSLAGLADHLIVATDPDDEGDVIAADVARLVQKIRPDLPISRIRLQALSPTALTSALERKGPVGEGVAGTVRRVFDRWIGGNIFPVSGGSGRSCLFGISVRRLRDLPPSRASRHPISGRRWPPLFCDGPSPGGEEGRMVGPDPGLRLSSPGFPRDGRTPSPSGPLFLRRRPPRSPKKCRHERCRRGPEDPIPL